MIIIIDDNPMDRYLLRRQISQLRVDAQIEEYDDGDTVVSQGLKKLYEASQTEPIVLFLDLNMPACDGFEVLEAIEAQKLLHWPEITIMTSSDHQKDKDRVFEFKMVKNYLVKGQFDLEELERIVSGQATR